MVREIARHRFLRSNQIATLVGRSLDRTNERLSLLFHAGYIDRPRAQLDRFPTEGSSHMVYALANDGARLLRAHGADIDARLDLSRKNRSVLRPFIEHQLEIMDFLVALQCATRARSDVSLIHPEEIVAAFPEATRAEKHPQKLKVRLSHKGKLEEFGLVPDLLFGLRYPDGSRRCFMVEIDRGTMPVARKSFAQTSYERKMRAYSMVYATKLHVRQFGWRAFRVLTVTNDPNRAQTMRESLRDIHVPHGLGPPLFFFSTRDNLSKAGPLSSVWQDGHGCDVTLI
ncbi:MAG: replication-relaxation family protein [Pseudorhodoplanes sp.]|nr:replication-relaxation family protein [Pseudorhodoplanes sp.]